MAETLHQCGDGVVTNIWSLQRPSRPLRASRVGDQRPSCSAGTRRGTAQDEINSEIAVHTSELAGLDAALRAAGEHLEEARQREASRADRESALALRAEVKALIACGSTRQAGDQRPNC